MTLEGSADPDGDAPGARDRASRRDLMHRLRGHAAIMQPHAFYVGRTALAIYDLPLAYDGRHRDLCVAVLAPARAPRCNGIRGTKVVGELVSIDERDGVRVASPSSLWAMLASELTERDLVVIGDAMVRIPRDDWGRPRPERRLATIAQLEAAAWAPYRRRRPKLVDALGRVRIGSMSPLETDFRLLAEDAGLPEPELDVELRGPDGRLLGIADAVYRAQRTVVEVEGDHHRLDKAQWNRDLEKYAAFASQGWDVVRLTAEHIRGRERRAISLVRAALARHDLA